ncbi:MAG: cyclic nucleotide-binding domain-containing protein [Desulfobacteraceae bacterium]
MQFKQADILTGLDKAFVARMMEIGKKAIHPSGTILFRQGDPASQFYILIKGRVRLGMGDNRYSVYTVNHGGEAFGWTALVGGQTYTASAECIDSSTLIAFDRDQVQMIMDGDPHNAILFYKNLALTLGNRLTLMTANLSDHLSVNDKISYGSGQVQETAESV